MQKTLKRFWKSLALGVVLAVLFALIETGVLDGGYYTFLIIGLLAFGVVLAYEFVVYVFHKTT